METQDLVGKYRDERADLRRQMTALQARVDKIDAFLKAYDALEPNGGAVGSDSVLGAIGAASAALGESLRGAFAAAMKATFKDRVIQGATTILADGKPRHTTAIIAEMEKHGLVFNTQNKVVTVSRILGQSGMFKPSRKVGWSLKK